MRAGNVSRLAASHQELLTAGSMTSVRDSASEIQARFHLFCGVRCPPKLRQYVESSTASAAAAAPCFPRTLRDLGALPNTMNSTCFTKLHVLQLTGIQAARDAREAVEPQNKRRTSNSSSSSSSPSSSSSSKKIPKVKQPNQFINIAYDDLLQWLECYLTDKKPAEWVDEWKVLFSKHLPQHTFLRFEFFHVRAGLLFRGERHVWPLGVFKFSLIQADDIATPGRLLQMRCAGRRRNSSTW